jgi:DNA helicase-2/ATP-dependent DNA helicase PcrA
MLRDHPRLVGRTSKFSIYNEDEAKSVIAGILMDSESTIIGPKQVLNEISAAKNHYVSLADYEEFAQDEASRIVARAWLKYEEELKLADAMDFDDLLLRSVDLLRANPEILEATRRKYRTVLVDEYQDTNPTQARLLRLLAGRDFMAVGDDKQVIYGFRLADVRLILDFEREYPGAIVLTLQTNYRCSPQIIKAANNLIAYNKVQRPMEVKPARRTKDGPPVHVHASGSDKEETEWIASRLQRFIEQGVKEKDIAVLARNGKVVEGLEHTLAAAGISYQLVGSRGYFQHPEVRAALAHLRLLVNPRNEDAFVTALGTRASVAEKTIAKIIAYAERHRLTLIEASTGVDLIQGTITSRAREHVRRFAYDMLEFARRTSSVPVSELVHDVIRMPLGVAEMLKSSDDENQCFQRLQTLTDAARSYERQTDTPTLAGWLQEAALAGRDDLTDPDKDGGRVTVGTIHAVKGLEWKVLIAAGFDGNVIPSYWAKSEAEIEEERRMAYVLATRATRVLIFSYANYRNGRRSGPSRFIAEALSPPKEHQKAADADSALQPADHR